MVPQLTMLNACDPHTSSTVAVTLLLRDGSTALGKTPHWRSDLCEHILRMDWTSVIASGYFRGARVHPMFPETSNARSSSRHSVSVFILKSSFCLHANANQRTKAITGRRHSNASKTRHSTNIERTESRASGKEEGMTRCLCRTSVTPTGFVPSVLVDRVLGQKVTIATRFNVQISAGSTRNIRTP